MTEHPILFSGPMIRALLSGRKTQTRRIVKPGAQARRLFMTRVYTGDRWTVLPHPGGGWWAIDVPGYRPDQRAVDTHGFPGPYGAPGDRLWVREAFGWFPELYYCGVKRTDDEGGFPRFSKQREPDPMFWRRNPNYRPGNDAEARQGVGYRANGADTMYAPAGGWRPSIHMPRWASRLTLEIVDVRVERVQEITEEDARAEGLQFSDGAPEMDTGFPTEAAFGARDVFANLWDAINGKRAPWASNPWVWALTFRRVEPSPDAAGGRA